MLSAHHPSVGVPPPAAEPCR